MKQNELLSVNFHYYGWGYCTEDRDSHTVHELVYLGVCPEGPQADFASRHGADRVHLQQQRRKRERRSCLSTVATTKPGSPGSDVHGMPCLN